MSDKTEELSPSQKRGANRAKKTGLYTDRVANQIGRGTLVRDRARERAARKR